MYIHLCKKKLADVLGVARGIDLRKKGFLKVSVNSVQLFDQLHKYIGEELYY